MSEVITITKCNVGQSSRYSKFESVGPVNLARRIAQPPRVPCAFIFFLFTREIQHNIILPHLYLLAGGSIFNIPMRVGSGILLCCLLAIIAVVFAQEAGGNAAAAEAKAKRDARMYIHMLLHTKPQL